MSVIEPRGSRIESDVGSIREEHPKSLPLSPRFGTLPSPSKARSPKKSIWGLGERPLLPGILRRRPSSMAQSSPRAAVASGGWCRIASSSSSVGARTSSAGRQRGSRESLDSVERRDAAPSGFFQRRSLSIESQSSSKRGTRASRGAFETLRRRVWFCSSPKNQVHDVTPYGQEYGVHPKFFDFDRKGRMTLNDAGIAEDMRRQEAGELPLTVGRPE